MYNIYSLIRATSSLIAIDILLFAIILFILWSQSGYTKRIRTNYYFVVFLITVFCVFSFFDTDWFSYLTIYNNYGYTLNGHFDFSLEHLFGKEDYSHMESIYTLFYNASFGSYILFRVYIWGTAVIILTITAKRMGVASNAFFIVFCTCYLLYFCYGRVSLAYSTAFLGFSFIVKPLSKRILSIALGLSLIVLSLVFHKSAFFVIPIFIVSLLPFNKKTVNLFALAIIPVAVITNLILTNVVQFDVEDNLTLYTLQEELDRSTDYSFSGSFIRLILSRYLVFLPYYIFFIGIIIKVKKGELKTLPESVQKMASSACWIIFISTVFLFANQYLMYYRFLLFSMIPISITLASLFIRKYSTDGMVKAFLLVGLLVSSYKILYMFYLSLVE